MKKGSKEYDKFVGVNVHLGGPVWVEILNQPKILVSQVLHGNMEAMNGVGERQVGWLFCSCNES